MVGYSIYCYLLQVALKFLESQPIWPLIYLIILVLLQQEWPISVRKS